MEAEMKITEEKVVFDAISKLAQNDGVSVLKFCETLQNDRNAALKEQENREKNKQGAVGSLKSKDTDYGMSYINAMLKAINK